ncbi:MAG TPA: tRNA lysidine(34) synthetase TilS [Opitutaceae bacterium]|nr:tRNA lysidine(34) synthetase TilS [Opitutaceae bacterium]
MPARKTIWPRRAEKLAALLPRERLHPAALRWLEGGSKEARGRWVVALSGGADSLALLLLLWAHWPVRRKNLLALHFNHRLRGRASDGDERFCRRLCAALGVGFFSDRWPDAPRHASAAAARTARFDFFQRQLRRLGLHALCLAHQQDDVAETLLMRIARGSGTGALAAPRPLQRIGEGRIHVRPLLGLKKAEIVAALRTADIPWREDASNSTDDHLRNRLRRTVLPAWRRSLAERDALAGAAWTRELLEEDDDALETWLTQTGAVRADGGLEVARLDGCPRAVVRRALHRWLRSQPHAGELSRAAFAVLLAALEMGRPVRHSLGVNGFAVIRNGRLEFESVAARRARK